VVGVATILFGSVLGIPPTSLRELYLSEADVRSTIEAQWEFFEACESLFEEGVEPPPKTVYFVIGRDGLVTSAELAEPESPAIDYSSCLVRQISGLVFPNHWENPIALRYVFTWGSQGLIMYPRVPLPERRTLPIGLGFFGVSTEALYDFLFGAETANGNID